MSNTPKAINDCFASDKARMRHDDVLALIRVHARPVASAGVVPLEEACNRVCAAAVHAPHAVPLHRNSAVDGYAFRHADYMQNAGQLHLAGRCAAGETGSQTLDPAQCVRIFTGASLPKGADTVAMQEDVIVPHEASNDGTTPAPITIPSGLKRGANVRAAGEDLAQGASVTAVGQRLRAQDIAALASVGLTHISCFAPLRVALLSTGNEIIRPGAPLERGQVYDANHFLLRSLLRGLGAQISDCSVLPDDRARIAEAMTQAAEHHDVIITTGGASRGDEDHVIKTLDAHGVRHFWQLAVKPGRPMAFGQMGTCTVLALPGNPVAVMVCFLLYGRPVLQGLEGEAWRSPQRYAVTADFEMAHKKPHRREFLRGTLYEDANLAPCVRPFANSGSGIIASLRAADGLIELPESITQVRRGQRVDFIPFAAFGIGL